MDIKCINHECSREVSQMKWAIFGDLDVDIVSEICENVVKTTVIFEGKEYFDETVYTEKNDIKRSLYKASFKIRDWDTPWGILTGINPAKLAYDDFCKEKFMEKYFVQERQADLCGKVADFTKNIKTCEEEISIYIGIPFCKTKCKYCSFVSNAIDRTNKYQSKYIDCLVREIETVSKLVRNRKIRAIYIGGGTPTALDEENLKRLLMSIDENFSKEHLYEYTVEAGRVDTITREKLEILKEFNVDRISINPQVFDDEVLEKIGRTHTSQDVIDTYYLAREIGFKCINMDIIYGLGGDFNKTVDILNELDPENITIHTLAIKKGSNINKSYQAELGDINYFYENIKHKPYYMYRQQYMIKPYENVGFCKDGFECLYNVYMMENLMDIVAIGSGSTSKIAGENHFNNKYPLDYINNIDSILEKKKEIFNKRG